MKLKDFQQIEEEPPQRLLSLNIPTDWLDRINFSNQRTQRSYLEVLSSMEVQVITHIQKAELLWRKFAYAESLFDTWEFRYAWYQGYKFDPYFITLLDNHEVVGVMPLWFDPEKKLYEWFGSYWHEDNKFFVKDLFYLPMLLAATPKNISLNAIKPDDLSYLNELGIFVDDDAKYWIGLNDINSFEDDFLPRLNKKRRYNIRRDIRLMQSLNPIIEYDNFSRIKDLGEISIERFGEDSDFVDKRRYEVYEQIIKIGRHSKVFNPRVITVLVDGKVAGVELNVIYKDTYYALKCGYRVDKFYGIGNYMSFLDFEDAKSMNLNKIDVLEGSFGWKDKWFEEVPLLKFEK